MTSLIYRTLDEHVIGGLADHPALDDERGPMSYAQLLHESASLAGALRDTGVHEGTSVAIDLRDGREQVVAVLACARIGAVPQSTADFGFGGTPPVLTTPDTEIPWAVLIRAGRLDPAPAPESDPEGYEGLMLELYAEVFETLIAGETIS
ncbi:AMP-binding protein [Aeromicrobium sp.]|uniref:AMP-binding protein n=1 Tax=Aeromicrobium sp. TaxID=1871063 RepID=UPI00198463A4|nr:AMP-binding protein [Aeromicrobium sp.]MBC7633111.1 AMP-binding protein [Aeromicrobium sp.]